MQIPGFLQILYVTLLKVAPPIKYAHEKRKDTLGCNFA
jgi:hypothetical protein